VSVVLQIVLYGIVAAFSPTVLLATLAVLASGRGRLNGTVFLVAFVVGQVLAFLLAYLVGAAFSLREGTGGTVSAALEVAGGVALVAIAWSRRRGPLEEAVSGSRSEALFARLHHVRPAVSFGVGMPLGVGVKRLVIALLAATAVAGAGLDLPEEVGLSALYVVIACSVVWIPVLVYLVLGAHADDLMASVKEWITRHERTVFVYTAVVFGIFLVLDGVLQLLL
jgi:MFS family permease